jgi:Restriction endonuclease
MNQLTPPSDDPALLSRDGLISFVRRLSGESSGFARLDLTNLLPSDLQNILSNLDELSAIHPRHFEALVAELLRADGYDSIRLVPRHNAPGPDIIALCEGPSRQKQQYLVECKRWKDAVGVEVVRNLMYQVDFTYRVTGGIIVTTSRFTRDAKQEADLHQWRLTLVDGSEVVAWASRFARDQRQRVALRPADLPSPEGLAVVLDALQACSRGRRLKLAPEACTRCQSSVVCGSVAVTSDEPLDVLQFHLCLFCGIVLTERARATYGALWRESVLPTCYLCWSSAR